MNEPKHNPDALDQLLDKSLGQYSQSEPLTGLEDRILSRLGARLQDAPAESSFAAWFTGPRLQWAFTAAVLVAGIGAGVFMVTRPAEEEDYVGEATQINVGNKMATAETAMSPLPASIPLLSLPPDVPRMAMPKIEAMLPVTEIRGPVFPTPTPLSEQERLTLSYVRVRGQQTMTASAVPEAGIRDLEVAPLVLPLLRVDELEKPVKETVSNTSK